MKFKTSKYLLFYLRIHIEAEENTVYIKIVFYWKIKVTEKGYPGTGDASPV